MLLFEVVKPISRTQQGRSSFCERGIGFIAEGTRILPFVLYRLSLIPLIQLVIPDYLAGRNTTDKLLLGGGDPAAISFTKCDDGIKYPIFIVYSPY